LLLRNTGNELPVPPADFDSDPDSGPDIDSDSDSGPDIDSDSDFDFDFDFDYSTYRQLCAQPPCGIVYVEGERYSIFPK
jgi:hypothetical protein